jgi:hypothetical protein
MSDAKAGLNILWDTLKLSAKPLKGRSDILVVAYLRVQQANPRGYDEYRLNFEINRKHGLVSYDMEVRVPDAGADGPSWRYSGRRDIVGQGPLPHDTALRTCGWPTRLDC